MDGSKLQSEDYQPDAVLIMAVNLKPGMTTEWGEVVKVVPTWTGGGVNIECRYSVFGEHKTVTVPRARGSLITVHLPHAVEQLNAAREQSPTV